MKFKKICGHRLNLLLLFQIKVFQIYAQKKKIFYVKRCRGASVYMTGRLHFFVRCKLCFLDEMQRFSKNIPNLTCFVKTAYGMVKRAIFYCEKKNQKQWKVVNCIESLLNAIFILYRHIILSSEYTTLFVLIFFCFKW